MNERAVTAIGVMIFAVIVGAVIVAIVGNLAITVASVMEVIR